MAALKGRFFCVNNMELTVIPNEEVVQEKVSLKSRPQAIQVKHEAPKVELSDNIKRFDKKVKIHTSNPFAFNTVSKRQVRPITNTTQTASQMIVNPTYNSIGKFLGVDTIHDWGRYYDKVHYITEWAREKVGNDTLKIMKYLTQKLNHTPTMGAKRIDDLHIAARLELEKRRK